MNVTEKALIDIILFIILPGWGIAGYVDWYCHKRSKIETTTGTLESIAHSLMGLQIGVPIYLCLLFRVNALILLICLVSLILHEVVAHCDIKMALPKRAISILEMHAHSYLATIPIFVFLMIIAINWELVENLITSAKSLDQQFTFVRTEYVFGGTDYLPLYSLFMLVGCVIPYAEELYRCLRARGRRVSSEV